MLCNTIKYFILCRSKYFLQHLFFPKIETMFHAHTKLTTIISYYSLAVPFCLLIVRQRFGGTCCIHLQVVVTSSKWKHLNLQKDKTTDYTEITTEQLLFYFITNDGKLQPDMTHPRRQTFSRSVP